MPKESKFNKSAFIRSMPKATAAEIIKAAASKGVKMSSALVYVTRSKDKKPSKKGPGRPKGSKPRASKSNGGSDLLQFKQLVVKIGLPAAERYMAELRASVGL